MITNHPLIVTIHPTDNYQIFQMITNSPLIITNRPLIHNLTADNWTIRRANLAALNFSANEDSEIFVVVLRQYSRPTIITNHPTTCRNYLLISKAWKQRTKIRMGRLPFSHVRMNYFWWAKTESWFIQL